MSDRAGLQGSSEEMLEGILDSVTYSHEGTNFLVAKLVPDDAGDVVTVVGRAAGPQIGQHMRLWGRWVLNPRYGRQFQFERYHVTPPSTVEGLRRYLASGAIPGIADVLAERIIEKFGDRALDILDREPARLGEIEGIGRKKLRKIEQAWATSREQREILLFLASHGIGGALAHRIHERYGPETMHVLQTDPFRLVRQVHGIGFRTADQIAQKMGLPKDSPERASAAVVHVLDEASRRGHLFLPLEYLQSYTATQYGVPAPAVEGAIATLAVEDDLVLVGEGPHAQVYLPIYHRAEEETAAQLRLMNQEPSEFTREEIERALEGFQQERKLTLHPLQREGLLQLATSRLLIITGGPGTGKTTLLECLMRLLDSKGLSTSLAAPTGRAAKRMEEASGVPAQTIHRLLKFDPKYQCFQVDQDNPLQAKCVVVDEASMLDMLLAHALTRALRPETYLVLMGDVDQLPAVGPGSVLRDMIASGSIPTVTLHQVFRQAEESAISINAHRINEGKLPILQKDRTERGQEFFMLERRDPAEVARTVVDLFCHRVPRAYGFDPLRDIQVLCPMHKGDAGTQNLNVLIQKELKSTHPGRTNVGDRVMQIVNNYDKEVFNGDAGVVQSYDSQKDELEVDFDGRLIRYTGAERVQLVLAYAISVHKSQGSEYPAVILPLTTQHFLMLQRNLLYTAVTRARKLAILVGSTEALAQAVRNNRIQKRNSRLAELLAARGPSD